MSTWVGQAGVFSAVCVCLATLVGLVWFHCESASSYVQKSRRLRVVQVPKYVLVRDGHGKPNRRVAPEDFKVGIVREKVSKLTKSDLLRISSSDDYWPVRVDPTRDRWNFQLRRDVNVRSAGAPEIFEHYNNFGIFAYRHGGYASPFQQDVGTLSEQQGIFGNLGCLGCPASAGNGGSVHPLR